MLVGLHASAELIFWFTPLLYALALIVAAMVMFTEHDLAASSSTSAAEG